MGKWTPNHTDGELTNKISTLVTGALRRAAIDDDPSVANMTFENFVRDLDTGDAFTATMVEILVKEVAERRTRPQPDRRYLSQRTTASLRKLAMPLNQYPSRVRPSRRSFATMLPEDDEDNYDLMVAEAAAQRGTSSAELYDALSIPWPGRTGRVDGEESSIRTTAFPLRVRSPPTGSTAAGSGSTSSAPPASRGNYWSVPPPAPGTTLTRQASIRRPFTSRNIEFNNFTRRHRSAHRDGLDGEGLSDIPVAEPRDEPWTTRASSTNTGPYGSARRFFPAITTRRIRGSRAAREEQQRMAGMASDSSSDEDLLGLANAGTEQFLAYTGHPSLRAILGGTSSSGAGPSSTGPSISTTGFAGPSGSGDGFGEIPTSDERTGAGPVSTPAIIPSLRRGGVRAPESMVTPIATPPAEESSTSQPVLPGPRHTVVEEALVSESPREEPAAYPTPGSTAEGEHLT